MDISNIDPNSLATIPVARPPPGMVSNFINPPSRSYIVSIAIGVTTPIMLILVLLRTYIRIRVIRAAGADDYLCILATLFALVNVGLTLSLLDKPGGSLIGVHLWDVPLSHLLTYQKLSVIQEIFTRLTNTAVKISLLTFYLRLFGPVPHARIMIWAGLVTVLSFTLAFLITVLVACVPRASDRGGWLSPTSIARCSPVSQSFTSAATIFSVITDFYVLSIPMHLLPTLKLSRRRKTAVSVIFITASGACAASLVNVVFHFKLKKEADFSWDITPIYAASIIESNIGLICNSMPIVAVLFASWFKGSKNIQGRSKPYENQEPGEAYLPKVPSGALTGLLSLVRNMGSRGGTQFSEVTTLPTNGDLAAVDMDYHEQLKVPRKNGQGSVQSISHDSGIQTPVASAQEG